jgi:hypothetical protein
VPGLSASLADFTLKVKLAFKFHFFQLETGPKIKMQPIAKLLKYSCYFYASVVYF